MGSATRTCTVCKKVFTVKVWLKPKTDRIAVSCSEKCRRVHNAKKQKDWTAKNWPRISARMLRSQHVQRWKNYTSDLSAVDKWQPRAVLDGTASWRVL